MSNEPEKQPEVQASPEKLGPQGCRSSIFQNKGAPHYQHCREAQLGAALSVTDRCGLLCYLPTLPSQSRALAVCFGSVGRTELKGAVLL